MRQHSILIIGVLVLVFLAVGCTGNVKEEKTADQLAEEGIQAFNNERYQKAIDAFKKLRDWYPFSKHALQADLKIADAYYEMKYYEEAVIAYEEFERLHPRNEVIPFVIYRIGLCHYKRLDTIDRDQTPAKNALDAFNRLRRQFPDSEYAEKAAEAIRLCRKSLADHEMYVGRYYFKSEHYQSALHRFENVIDNYPEVGDVKAAEEYIELCRQYLKTDNSGQMQ